jgi:opacity protein-like surface antigen
MKETVMKKLFAVIVSFLMLSGVALSAGPAAPAPAAPEKQKPAKVAKVKKHHLKKVELTTGKYVSVQGGVTFTQDGDLNRESLVLDDGYSINVAFGKRLKALDKRVRVEAELGYQKSNVDTVDGKNDKYSGDVKAYSLLVNGYIDFVKGKKIVPYITAGIGLAKIDSDVNNFAHVDDGGLAYQVGAGIAYHINDNWHIDLKYRYFGVVDMNGFQGDSLNPEFATNSVLLGVRYRF